MEKDSAKESTQAAWDSLNACKGQVNSKQAALEPLRGARDARNSANKEFRSAFGDLDVRSEEELDARLAAIRHTIEHESIPLSEEKVTSTENPGLRLASMPHVKKTDESIKSKTIMDKRQTFTGTGR